MFSLESTNLTELGGRMGTERITTNWIRYFHEEGNARAFAEKDFKAYYHRTDDKIKWTRSRSKRNWETYSGDLGPVSYTIRKLKFEDGVSK